MFALGKRLSAYTVFHIPGGGSLTNAKFSSLSAVVEAFHLPLYVANSPLGSVAKDIEVGVNDLGVNNAEKYSGRLQGHKSTLPESFAEKELGR